MRNFEFHDHLNNISGSINLNIYKNGELIDIYNDHNLVVNGGRKRLAQLAAGLSTDYITMIGVGSGETQENEFDASLTDQQLFEIQGFDDTPAVTLDGLDVIFAFHIKQSEANGLMIHELGLFCSDGVMFSHRVRRGGIFKEEDIELKGTWTLHF